MSHFFLPDDYRDTIFDYTPDYLRAHGKQALLCDIDNTLVTYDDPVPTPQILAWLQAMKDAGIIIGFISNNHAPRVERFNQELGLFAAPDAHKPLNGALKRFIRETKLPKSAVAHVGDQIFTDVLMAHSLGITALLVPPIKDKKSLAFRFKRMLEKPLLAIYKRRHT